MEYFGQRMWDRMWDRITCAARHPRAQPGALNIHCGALNIHCGALTTHYGALNIHYGALNIHCGALNIHYGALNIHRGAFNIHCRALIKGKIDRYDLIKPSYHSRIRFSRRFGTGAVIRPCGGMPRAVWEYTATTDQSNVSQSGLGTTAKRLLKTAVYIRFFGHDKTTARIIRRPKDPRPYIRGSPTWIRGSPAPPHRMLRTVFLRVAVLIIAGAETRALIKHLCNVHVTEQDPTKIRDFGVFCEISSLLLCWHVLHRVHVSIHGGGPVV
eukprot:243967-Pyramimonas_sp.AAC.2